MKIKNILGWPIWNNFNFSVFAFVVFSFIAVSILCGLRYPNIKKNLLSGLWCYVSLYILAPREFIIFVFFFIFMIRFSSILSFSAFLLIYCFFELMICSHICLRQSESNWKWKKNNTTIVSHCFYSSLDKYNLSSINIILHCKC